MKLLQYIIVFIITSLNGSLVAASVGSPFTLYKGSKPFYSCNNQISDTVSFCIEATDYQCLCTNKNYLATVAGCLQTVGPSPSAVNGLVTFCGTRGVYFDSYNWLMIHFNCIYNKLNRRTRFKTSINLRPLKLRLF